jgi:hypothetical protein
MNGKRERAHRAYSITESARASTVGAISTPLMRAVVDHEVKPRRLHHRGVQIADHRDRALRMRGTRESGRCRITKKREDLSAPQSRPGPQYKFVGD